VHATDQVIRLTPYTETELLTRSTPQPATARGTLARCRSNLGLDGVEVGRAVRRDVGLGAERSDCGGVASVVPTTTFPRSIQEYAYEPPSVPRAVRSMVAASDSDDLK